MACNGARLTSLAESIEDRRWAPDQGSWTTLAGIDAALLRLGLVPKDPLAGQN